MAAGGKGAISFDRFLTLPYLSVVRETRECCEVRETDHICSVSHLSFLCCEGIDQLQISSYFSNYDGLLCCETDTK